MQQHGLLQRGVCRHTPPSSTRPRIDANACRAVQCGTHIRDSTKHQAAHMPNVSAPRLSYAAASSSSGSILPVIRGQPWLQAAALALLQLHLALAGHAADLVESNLSSSEGNIPSELSAAGETAAPALSSLMAGSNRKQVEGCTRKCVPTCVRGGEGSPGLGPLSVRKEIVVFKDGFRSRQYCLSECAQVCSLKMSKDSSSSTRSSSSSTRSSSGGQQQQQQQQQLGTSTASLGVP